MEDPEVIRENMENTRGALSEKLEALEDHVTSTVKGASTEVAETVETVTSSVQETVATVKDTVQDAVATVKDTVDDTITAARECVDAVKSILDVPAHVDRYPWIAVGGSLAFGFLLGEFLQSRNVRHPRKYEDSRSQESFAAPLSRNGADSGRTQEAGASSTAGGWLEQLAPELSQLKELALGALMGTFREMVVKAAGDKLAQPVSDIIDSVTEKIGGKPVPNEPKDETKAGIAEKPARKSTPSDQTPAAMTV